MISWKHAANTQQNLYFSTKERNDEQIRVSKGKEQDMLVFSFLVVTSL